MKKPLLHPGKKGEKGARKGIFYENPRRKKTLACFKYGVEGAEQG